MMYVTKAGKWDQGDPPNGFIKCRWCLVVHKRGHGPEHHTKRGNELHALFAEMGKPRTAAGFPDIEKVRSERNKREKAGRQKQKTNLCCLKQARAILDECACFRDK